MRLGPALISVVGLIGTVSAAGLPGPAVASGPVFTVQDPRIDENSGMVDLGALTVVTNDSGDTGRVFVLDRAGRTVGVTTYAAAATDVEALAPAGGDAVWVGDIGDNEQRRADVVVRRVPVARGDRSVSVPAYRLVYPDGPHDAETLLRDPRSGRLYVVTKSLGGGTVYAAPRRLDPGATNRFTRVGRVARVPVYATDGAFLAGGARVLVRSYGDVGLYAFPSWRLLRTVALPPEPQGESLSVGPDDRVRIGSEGVRQPVLPVALPVPSPRAGDRATASPASPTRGRDTAAAADHDDRVDGTERGVVWSVVGAIVVASLAGAGTGVVALRRRRD